MTRGIDKLTIEKTQPGWILGSRDFTLCRYDPTEIICNPTGLNTSAKAHSKLAQLVGFSSDMLWSSSEKEGGKKGWISVDLSIELEV